jgi:hypothetical protein
MPPTTAPLMIAPASQFPVVTPWMIPGAMPNPAPTRVATIGPPGTKNDAATRPTMAMLPHCVPVSCSRYARYWSIESGCRPSGSTAPTGSFPA